MRLAATALLGFVAACGPDARPDSTKSASPGAVTGAASAKPVSSGRADTSASVSASAPAPSPSAAPVASGSPAVEPVPLSAGASERPKLHGAIAFVGKVKGEGPYLFAATLDTIPLDPKRLSEPGTDWSISEASIDPTAKTVLFVHNHRENASAPPDEVWAAPVAGGAPHRVAKCKATCRTPFFLEDGRILFGDYGPGLIGGAIHVVTATGQNSVVFGGDKALSPCYVSLHVDPFGKQFVVRIANDLGWPECTVDRAQVGSSTDLKLTTLPALVTGHSMPLVGEDGRIYFQGGTEDKPVPSSMGADGKGLKAPDPAYDGKRVPSAGWFVDAEGGKIVAHPPAGDAHRPVVLFEADTIDEVAQSPVGGVPR